MLKYHQWFTLQLFFFNRVHTASNYNGPDNLHHIPLPQRKKQQQPLLKCESVNYTIILLVWRTVTWGYEPGTYHLEGWRLGPLHTAVSETSSAVSQVKPVCSSTFGNWKKTRFTYWLADCFLWRLLSSGWPYVPRATSSPSISTFCHLFAI